MSTSILLVLSVLILFACVESNTEEQAGEVVSSIDTSLGEASTIHSFIYRPIGNSDLGAAIDDGEYTEYGTSLAFVYVYGIVVIVAAILTGCCACCLSCCRNDDYSWIESWGKCKVMSLLSFILLLGLIASAAGGVGYYYSTNVTKATTEEGTGLLTIFGKLADDMVAYFNFLEGVIIDLQEQLDESVANILVILASSASVTSDSISSMTFAFNGLGDHLTTNNSVTTSEALEGLHICYKCAIIGNLSYEAGDSYEESVNGITTRIDSNVVEISDELTDVVNEIQENVTDFLVYSDDLVELSNDYFNTYYDEYGDYWKTGEDYRGYVMFVFFSAPALTVVIMLIASGCRSSVWFNVNAKCVWMAWFLMGVSLLIHLPLAAFFADSCVYLDEMTGEWETLDNDDRAVAKAYHVCVLGDSAEDRFGFSDAFPFRDSLVLDDISLEEVDDAFNTTELDVLNALVESLVVEDFIGLNSTEITADLVEFSTNSTYSDQSMDYTRVTIYDAIPNNTASEQFKDEIVASIEAETYAEAFIQSALSLMDTVNDSFVELQDNVTAMAVTLSSLDETELEPLFDQVDTLFADLNCDAIGDAYVSSENAICVEFLSGVAGISLMCAIIAFVTIPLYCLNGKANQIFIALNRDESYTTPESLDNVLESTPAQGLAGKQSRKTRKSSQPSISSESDSYR